MNNLKGLRLEHGLNMKQAANALNLPYTTYVSYEKGAREPNGEMLIKIANFYHTTVDFILNKPDAQKNSAIFFKDGVKSFSQTKTLPLLSSIICYEPLLSEENIESTVPVTENISADFAFKAKDDSMNGAHIFKDDIVFIKNQKTVENGEIAALLVDNEVSLKRFYRYGDTVVLRSDSTNCKEIEYKYDELNKIRIIGKAVYFFSKVK